MTQGDRTIDLVPRLRRSDLFGIDFPALPGWADVWRSALRALHLWRSLPCHFSLKLPQASQLLLMTKRRANVSSGNWFEGAQVSKARPGAPIDFTLRYCRGHKLCHFSPDSP